MIRIRLIQLCRRAEWTPATACRPQTRKHWETASFARLVRKALDGSRQVSFRQQRQVINQDMLRFD